MKNSKENQDNIETARTQKIQSKILLIGTSHISSQSIKQISEAVKSFQPDIIALELDRNRLHGLFNKGDKPGALKVIASVGLKGYLFSLIGEFAEKRLGDAVGIKPGDEMKHGARLAKKLSIPIGLIDQDLETTLRRFSSEFSWREKVYLISDLISGVFRRSEIEFDLSSVPSDKTIQSLLSSVKKRYPGLYKVLIHERNCIMAENLEKIAKKDPGQNILAIVGAGHKKAILKILNAKKIFATPFK